MKYCSRCRAKILDDDYLPSECPKCRERSRLKAAEERARIAKQRESQKFQNLPVKVPSIQQFFQYLKEFHKGTPEAVYEKLYQDYLKEKFGENVARYRIDKFPFVYDDCWQIREMILHYWGLVSDAKFKWTDATDRLVVGSHCSKCASCQRFYLYCERGEYNTKGDDYDSFYENLREAQRQVRGEDDFDRKLRKAMGLD
ncbi:hypothetical protein HXY33_05525 [Candidatus Bathyarchaeota archaeon]|nr:hypothetical protein [Candidatus Bathyarchaeota archaeon]